MKDTDKPNADESASNPEALFAAKPKDDAQTRPVSRADLKAFRSLITPAKISHYSDMSQKEVEAYQTIGPLLDELIDASK